MEEIKKKRKNLGISQFSLANASGIGRFRISILEMDYANATENEIKAMNTALSRLAKENALSTPTLPKGGKHV